MQQRCTNTRGTSSTRVKHAAGVCRHTGYMQLGYICSWGKMQLGKSTHEVNATEVYQHTGDIQLRCTGTRGVGRCMQPAYASTGYADTRNVSVVYGLDIAPSLACTTTLLTCTVHFYFGAWPEDLQIAETFNVICGVVLGHEGSVPLVGHVG